MTRGGDDSFDASKQNAEKHYRSNSQQKYRVIIVPLISFSIVVVDLTDLLGALKDLIYEH